MEFAKLLRYHVFGNGRFLAKCFFSKRDREILRLRMEGYTEQEIADRVGYQTASAVHKRISRIANAYEDFVTSESQKHLNQ